ncbi:MAG TPA: Hpt domain-containing protein [Gemmatimonadales bacterium]|jgi:HPt (histidine-containing phosphotransfer) domain-containing protein
MTQQSEIDQDALQRLSALGGEKLVHRIVGLFASFGVARVEDAERGFAEGDFAAVAAAAHALRSSAGNVGALKLLAVATELEHTARARRGDVVKDLVSQLRQCYDTARLQLMGPVFGGMS